MKRALLSMLAALLAAPTLAQARVRPHSAGGYSVQVEDAAGQVLPTYFHHGQTFVLGNYGQRYQLRVRNHTGQRVEAVVTVDGRDAVSGAVGDYRNQRGYIVPPYGSVVVDGFRQSHQSVAAFRFTTPGDSYSARRGTPQNVGVVGVAVFREKSHRPVPLARPQPAPRPWYGRAEGRSLDDLGGVGAESEAAPAAPKAGASESRAKRRAPMADYAPRQNNLGTQYGESRHSPVVEVPFVRRRAHQPDRVLAVYYDNAEGLASRGIVVYPTYYSGTPDPFPAERQFAPPPP